MWGYVKSVVYKLPFTGIDDLKKRITAAIMTVHTDMLHRTWQEPEYRLHVVRTSKGVHIGVYQDKLKNLRV
jgi:hypothetical protein